MRCRSVWGALVGQTWTGADDSGDSFCDCAVNPPDTKGSSLFYSFTAPSDGLLSVDTFGTWDAYGVSTTVSISSGCPADLTTELTCNFDVPDTQASLAMVANQTVVFHVRHTCTDDSTAMFDLNVSFDATNVEPQNDDCLNAQPVTEGTLAGESWLGADSSGYTNCGCLLVGTPASPGPSLWYSYTATADGTLTVDSIGSAAAYGVNLSIMLNSACPGTPATEVACGGFTSSGSDAEVSAPMLNGETLIIQVRNSCAFGNDDLFDLTVSFVNTTAFKPLCNGDGGDQSGCTDCPCQNNALPGTVGGCLNSTITSALLWVLGDPSVSLPPGATTDLRFGLDTGIPATFCVLTSGDAVAPANAGNPCFGLQSGVTSVNLDGLRCAVSNVLRHGGRLADSNGSVGVINSPWGWRGRSALRDCPDVRFRQRPDSVLPGDLPRRRTPRLHDWTEHDPGSRGHVRSLSLKE